MGLARENHIDGGTQSKKPSLRIFPSPTVLLSFNNFEPCKSKTIKTVDEISFLNRCNSDLVYGKLVFRATRKTSKSHLKSHLLSSLQVH